MKEDKRGSSFCVTEKQCLKHERVRPLWENLECLLSRENEKIEECECAVGEGEVFSDDTGKVDCASL